jgi:RHS repeat-associated protein
MVLVARVVLVAEIGFVLPPGAMAGGSGGSYAASSVVTYTYTTGCGQTCTGSATIFFCSASGSSSNNSASSSGTPAPWSGGSGNLGGGASGWNPGVSGGSTDSSDDCHPAPANNACSPPGSNPDDKTDCNHPVRRGQCLGVYKSVSSWVDLVRRRFRDNATDLMVPVPGGDVALWRDFDYGRWKFRMIDDLYALDAVEGKGIYLNGEVYRDATNSASSSVVGFITGQAAIRSSTQSTPQPQSVAMMPVGTYLIYGVGPARLVKNGDGTLFWSDDSGNERLYDSSGLLVARQYRGQLIAAYHYDASSLLTNIADRDGRAVLTFAYTGGQLTEARDFTGRSVTYGYDTEGRLALVTDPLGTQTTYSYDNGWHLTGKRTHLSGTSADADHQVTIAYQGRLPAVATAPPVRINQFTSGFVDPVCVRSVTHNTGESETFVFKYNSGDQTYYAQVTDSTGKVEESVFDASGALITKSVNGDQVYKMEEDATTRVTTRGGNQTTTEEFDAQGYLLRRIQPDGGIELFEYDHNLGRLTRHTDPAGVVTAYTYDSLGNELIRTEALGTGLERVTTSEYYPGTTLLKRETDPSGRAHAYEYDVADRVTRVYDPANPADQSTYTYDALGNRETETDALSRVTAYHHDALGHLTEKTDPLQQRTNFAYSGDRLVEIQTGRTATAPGRIVRYEYDSAGRRTKEKRVAADGVEQVFKTFIYDADGRVITETNAVGQSVTFGYDPAGNQSSISVPDAGGTPSITRSTYDLINRPTTVVDSAGMTRTIQYDLQDRPIVVTEGVGTPVERTARTRYDLLGHAVEIKQSDARDPARVYTTTCTYDALGRRTSLGGDRVYPETFVFDAADRVSSETDALGRVRSYDYDSSGRLMAVRLNGSLIASYTYDLVGNRLSVTDGEGNHRHFHYDALDRLTDESIPLPASQTAPDQWWTQPAFVLREAAYDPSGDVSSVATYTAAVPDEGSSLGATTAYAFDEFGRKVSETDPAGLTRTFSYDAADHLLSVTYPPVPSSGETQGAAELYLRSPNNAGAVVATIDRAGNRTGFSYDGALRVVSETNSLGGITNRTFDALGRVVSQTDPAGNITSYAYDLFDQPVQIIYPDHVAGTHERIGTLRYDNHGKLVEKAGAGDYPMTYAYDAVGNLISLTDGNQHTTHWSYDSNNLVQAKTYADGASYNYTYDGAGRVKTRQDALGRTTTYRINAYGLPTSIGYPTDPSVTLAYDQQGRRLSMVDGSGTTTWTYDSVGRTATETQGRSGRTMHFGYDLNSERTGLKVDGGSASWTTGYGYDNAGRLRTVLDDRLAAGRPYVYTYASNASLVTQLTTPTGFKTVKTYDNLGRLLSAISAGVEPVSGGGGAPVSGADGGVSPPQINSIAYTYDPAGQRVTESASERSRAFTYDAWRQLTQSVATSANPQIAVTDGYFYDAIGNRTQSARGVSTAPSETTFYGVNPVNQYTALTGAMVDSPAYDLNGNTVGCANALRSLGEGGAPLTLRYDEENRLVEVSDATCRSLYVYDGLGRRVCQQDFSWNLALGTWKLEREARFVYDGWRVIEETDATGRSLRSYTRGLDLSGSLEGAGGIGGLLALSQIANGQITNTATYFYDGNGNVTDLINDDGTSAAHYTYSSFGDRITATGALADVNPYQFSSKERDPLTGFYYYGFRFYNPTTGRWLSRDPLGEDAGVNLYAMISNDPVDGVDPTGLVLYAVGGTNSVTDNKTTNSRTNVLRFAADWAGPGIAHYHDGPGSNALWGKNPGNIAGFGSSEIAEQGYKFICAELQKQKGVSEPWWNDPVFLVGHSRGGAIVMQIANKLRDGCPCSKDGGRIAGPIPVRFIGLYDAVSMTPDDPSQPVPDNVVFVTHGLRDPAIGSRPLWGNTGTSGGKHFESETFSGNHSAMGGDPAEGDSFDVLTLNQNIRASMAVDKYIRDAARQQGAGLSGR